MNKLQQSDRLKKEPNGNNAQDRDLDEGVSQSMYNQSIGTVGGITRVGLPTENGEMVSFIKDKNNQSLKKGKNQKMKILEGEIEELIENGIDELPQQELEYIILLKDLKNHMNSEPKKRTLWEKLSKCQFSNREEVYTDYIELNIDNCGKNILTLSLFVS